MSATDSAALSIPAADQNLGGEAGGDGLVLWLQLVRVVNVE